MARPFITAVASAAVTAGLGVTLRRTLPGGASRWTRINHRGEPISLTEGPALALGLTAASVLGGSSRRDRTAATVATLGAGVFGLIDDLGETSARSGDPSSAQAPAKGLRGHLGALSRGEVTTGSLKIAGIGASALAASVIAGSGSPRRGGGNGLIGTAHRRGRGAMYRVATVGIDAALIAGSANLANLFDLRPGRVLKVVGAHGVALIGFERRREGVPTAWSAGIMGACAAAARDDLAERTMAGDCGANALGALVGFTASRALPLPARLAALTAVVGLTFASEKVSFSKVIAGNRALSYVDGLGRRPVADAIDRTLESPA